MPIKPEIAPSPIMDGPPGRNMPPMMPAEYRLYVLNKRLQEASPDCDNLWWDGLASEFFEDNATLSISMCMEDGPKHYSLSRTLIPRYFRSIFDGGAVELYFVTRHSKEIFNHATHSLSLDCAQATMMTHYVKPVLTKVCTDGHLMVEFSCDEFMCIRAWHFEVLGHSELIPKQLAMQGPEVLEKFGGNITKRGLPSTTINYLKLCVILEPMKEIMSRQKAYNIDPRDCLRNCLFQKWQRMMNPPEPAIRGTKRTTRKRKNSSTANAANQMPNSKKKNFPTSGVMIVGEPALMGGDFGDGDERMITRLENQYDQGTDGIKTENPDPTAANFPHTTSPAVHPNSNALSPWQQGQMPPTQPPQQRPPSQAGTNGPNIPPPSSGPGSQNPTDNNVQDLPTTPISAPN